MSDLVLKSDCETQKFDTPQSTQSLSACAKKLEQFKMPETPDDYFNFFYGKKVSN